VGANSGGDPAAEPVLLIPDDLLAAMVDHCRREAPLECCGILGGVPPRASSLHLLRNTDRSETRYNADPADILAALRYLRERGEQFLAIYHSHPRWAAIPSRTDLATNYYGDLPRIIVSLLGEPPDVRAWRLEPDRYDELPWRVVPAGGVERPGESG
jgi:proteasome lid subunit RPN8/RPN11